MKVSNVVIKETKHIAAGVAIGVVVMYLVFLLLGRFDYTVLLGGILGAVFAIMNFFLLGLGIQKALTMGDNAKKFMYTSYTYRMLLYGVCIVMGALIPCFQIAATIIPLFMPQPVIYIMRFLGYRPEEQEQKQEEGEN